MILTYIILFVFCLPAIIALVERNSLALYIVVAQGYLAYRVFSVIPVNANMADAIDRAPWDTDNVTVCSVWVVLFLIASDRRFRH